MSGVELSFPDHLSRARRSVVQEIADRNDTRHGAGLLGLVLSGSAGRGLATERSDVDVLVVLADEALGDRVTTHSVEADEAPVSLTELRDLPVFSSEGWYFRWTCAWAPVLLDRTDGELPGLLRRRATVTDDETLAILLEHDRLDGWLNHAYRALKNDRDGRTLERRLDAAESVPWLLDTVFSLVGRVRPYHKYLPWELRTHPVTTGDATLDAAWSADVALDLLTATLDGDPAAIRAAFAWVSGLCAAFDARLGTPRLTSVIEGWGAELDLLRR